LVRGRKLLSSMLALMHDATNPEVEWSVTKIGVKVLGNPISLAGGR
jgi:hypothetical protein